VETGRLEALEVMPDDDPVSLRPPSKALGELGEQLLLAGGLLSQIINTMITAAYAPEEPPEFAPIPEIAHALICDTMHELESRYTADDLIFAATVVRDATAAIGENVFFVNPEESWN
jgi:hypothetical protein